MCAFFALIIAIGRWKGMEKGCAVVFKFCYFGSGFVFIHSGSVWVEGCVSAVAQFSSNGGKRKRCIAYAYIKNEHFIYIFVTFSFDDFPFIFSENPFTFLYLFKLSQALEESHSIPDHYGRSILELLDFYALRRHYIRILLSIPFVSSWEMGVGDVGWFVVRIIFPGDYISQFVLDLISFVRF